jgi:hypothetical protein
MPEESRAISAEEPTPKHPFTQARETWDAWSMANTMRLALAQAREQGDDETLASFAQHPEWTQGPGPLDALRANHTQVELLTGWRWQAVRDAREQGHAWAEVGEALGTTPEQARQDYLDRIGQERHLADRHPDLAPLIRYEPRWAELAQLNAADHAHQHDREAGRDR